MIRNSAIFSYKSQDDDIPQDFFIGIFDLKKWWTLPHYYTFRQRMAARRLLFSTTETNCIVVGCRSWRTQPCRNYLPPDPPAKAIYRRRLCLATTAHLSDYNSLSIHTQCAWVSGGLIPHHLMHYKEGARVLIIRKILTSNMYHDTTF